ncbi:hypothetical protein GLP43_04800 [Sulfitobacter sp. M39]|uniref:S1 family peptidase n=1 Tax=Sulfitobacter sp. M39 TaxID=2675334 RepID=UPI001F35BDCA|nr:serine protease [Sulfitobacter sp. M39]MCF7746886.1 hypothetical protein [Sulfitobacter sp. M39]
MAAIFASLGSLSFLYQVNYSWLYWSWKLLKNSAKNIDYTSVPAQFDRKVRLMTKFVHEGSLAAFKIFLCCDEVELSQGTGFLYGHAEKTYLVTNRHNISGRNTLTGQYLDRDKLQPNWLSTDVRVSGSGGIRSVAVGFGWGFSGTKAWLEHPAGPNVDVVACDVSEFFNEQSGSPVRINEISSESYLVEVADEVFLLGYPLGLHLDDFPIWKRGTIASEPALDYEGRPMMVVDTASNKGMSGSPVILRKSDGRMADGSQVFGGPVGFQFLGVYSGRVAPKRDLDAQLGMVWRAQVIGEIIAANTQYEPPMR